ncbi:hypothetical protein GGR58DRAFT_228888 [Xylaria digitata]|nr:hypothetical protein GGR58DRAFT_228888 [Xylaria digitata]
MPLRIYQLPTRILTDVLEKFDDIEYLPPVLRAHGCFRIAFRSRSGIAERIIQRQIHPRLLPLAVANYEVSRFTFTSEDVEGVVQIYMNVLNDPHRFSLRLRVRSPQRIERPSHSYWVIPIGMGDLLQMGRIHNYIRVFVKTYALWACHEITASSDPIVLTEAEELRFFVVFYRLELFLKLCEGDRVGGERFGETRTFRVLSLLPPWEQEQLACVCWCLQTLCQGKTSLYPS